MIFISIGAVHSATYKCDPNAKCGCSKESTAIVSRIVGGEIASNQTWNWIVSLQEFDSHICGASLITPEYAITAAHCVLSKRLSTLSILAGTNYLYDQNAQRRTIIEMFIHPEYNIVFKTSDIAILKFAPLDTSSNANISFICLPEEDQDPFVTGENLTAIGWGITTLAIANESVYLRQVTLKAHSLAAFECEVSGLTDEMTQFCAGSDYNNRDTCSGDNGGPLMAFVNNRWVLAGITSFGRGCGFQIYAGVYTRVSTFISYIKAATQPLTTTITRRTTTTTTTLFPMNDGRSLYQSIILMLSLQLVVYFGFLHR